MQPGGGDEHAVQRVPSLQVEQQEREPIKSPLSIHPPGGVDGPGEGDELEHPEPHFPSQSSELEQQEPASPAFTGSKPSGIQHILVPPPTH